MTRRAEITVTINDQTVMCWFSLIVKVMLAESLSLNLSLSPSLDLSLSLNLPLKTKTPASR